jgi:chitodextrinase
VAVKGYTVAIGSRKATAYGTAYVLRDVDCGTAIAVSISAFDAAGNRSSRASVIASTAACEDTRPPSPPSGFSQAATSEEAVVLAWDPSRDDVGVVSYGIYRGSGRVASTAEPTVTLARLSCGSTDAVSIDAIDAAGNRSTRETVYTETTPCASPIQPLSATGAQQQATWTRCAREGERCSFAGTGDVRYGADGRWTSPRPFTGGVACTNQVFGDPLYGVVKSCEYRGSNSTPQPDPPPGQWAYCATEGRSCLFSGSREVRYGANGRWTSTRTFSGGVACTNQVFGDPLYGVVKSCESRTSSQAPPPAPPADTVPPAKPLLSLGSVTHDTATLRWQPGSDNVGVHHYNVWLDSTMVAQATGLSHKYTGLRCNTDYLLGLEAVDAAGNKTVLAQARWPIRTLECLTPASQPPADTEPPSRPTNPSVTRATTTSVELAWTPSADNVGVSGYEVERAGSGGVTAAAPTATITGLSCAAAYTFGIRAFDAAGNRSAPASLVASTAACSGSGGPDSQPPTAPTNVVVTSRTATSIALTWSASSDNVGVRGYTLYRGGTQLGTTSSTSGIFSELTCNANYTLGVAAYDDAGNHSSPTTLLVSTTACPDTTPPSTPAGLTASSVMETSLNFSWIASTDNVGVAGYDVYRNGTKMASPTTTTSAQAGLACGTSYAFGVESFDAAGNRSGRAQLTVATRPCAPTPPTSGVALAVSPTGNDSTCVRGDLGRACQSFDRAYQLAQCGDVVEIAGGSYAEQTLVERGSCSAPITLQAKAGQTPFTQRVWLGSSRGSYSNNAPDDLVLRGIKTAGVIMWGDVEDVTLDRIDGGSFFVRGGKRITVSGSDWGPCPSPSHGSSANQCLGYSGPQQTRIAPQSAASDTADILIQGNVFHDHPAVSPDHWECIYTTGGTNVTIRGNRFYNCQNSASVFLDGEAVHSLLGGTWIVENNWFGFQGASSLGIGSNALPFLNGQLIARFNSFAAGESVHSHGDEDANGTVTVVGNILGEPDCIEGAVYLYNVILSGSCSGSGNATVGTLPYINTSSGAAGDYHLVAGSAAERFVPSSAAHSALAIDYDGQARSAPRSAGSDDR